MSYNAVTTTRIARVAGTVVLVVLGWLCLNSRSYAGPIWWQDTEGYIVNNPDESFTLTFPAGDPSSVQLVDEVYTYSLAGDYTTNFTSGVMFSFSNSSASYVDFRFQSSNRLWTYAFTPSAGLAPYDIPFRYSESWTYPDATEADFYADLHDVQWIGYLIQRSDISEEEIFAVSAVVLYVPEPADYCLLAAGICGLILVFRKRLRAWHWSAGVPA